MPPEYRCERTDIFSQLNNIDWFTEFYIEQTRSIYQQASLSPYVSLSRLKDAYTLYQKDLKRISEIELAGQSLDHYKHCGHLCYWWRRVAPISDFDSLFDNNNTDSREDVEYLREILIKYSNEYIAFDIGYRICRFFESKRDDVAIAMAHLTSKTQSEFTSRASPLMKFHIDRDYIRTICHFLKEKNVSPHAMFLIYRSLFYQVRDI